MKTFEVSYEEWGRLIAAHADGDESVFEHYGKLPFRLTCKASYIVCKKGRDGGLCVSTGTCGDLEMRKRKWRSSAAAALFLVLGAFLTFGLWSVIELGMVGFIGGSFSWAAPAVYTLGTGAAIAVIALLEGGLQ